MKTRLAEKDVMGIYTTIPGLAKFKHHYVAPLFLDILSYIASKKIILEYGSVS